MEQVNKVSPEALGEFDKQVQIKTKQTRQKKQPDPLLARIENLEAALEKVATLGGNGNHLREFNLTPWCPSKKDMAKYK